MRQKLSIVTLGVSDLNRSRAFYQDGLGWKPSSCSQESIIFFDLGGVGLALFSFDELAKDANVSPVRSGFTGITLAHNVNSAEEVDAVMQKAKQSGARIIKKAQQVFWGGYSGYFSDPDGYLWEVAWNPFIETDAKGALIFP